MHLILNLDPIIVQHSQRQEFYSKLGLQSGEMKTFISLGKASDSAKLSQAVQESLWLLGCNVSALEEEMVCGN